MGAARKLREIVWGTPAETKAERRLILKIDFFILTYVALMYWVRISSLTRQDLR